MIRAVTELVVRRPLLWPLVRRPVRNVFERLAPAWDDLRTPGALDAFRAALATIDVPPSHALDLGTGTGVTAAAVLARHPEAALVGLDASSDVLAQARSVLPEATFVIGALEDRLPRGPFDLVVSALAIHHLTSDGKADLFQFDTDGDGKVDITMVDLDQDGKPDRTVLGDGGHPPE